MYHPTTGFALLLSCALGVTTRAQGPEPAFEERLVAVELALADGDHRAALAHLLAMEPAAADDVVRLEQLADGLFTVASALQPKGPSEDRLAALEALLRVQAGLDRGGDTQATIETRNEVAVCLDGLGRSDEALAQFDAVGDGLRRILGDGDHTALATVACNAARTLVHLGRATEACARFGQALAMLRRLHGERDDADVADALGGLADALVASGRALDALPDREAALAMCRRLYAGRDHDLVAEAIGQLGNTLVAAGHADEALPSLEAALAMQRRLRGDDDHPHLVARANDLALCLQTLGRADEALPLLDAALAMQARLAGGRDRSFTVTVCNNLALCLVRLGRPADALPRYEQAAAMQRRLSGDRDRPARAAALHNLAACLAALGRPAEALPLYETALAMRRRLAGERDHPDVAASMNNIANCLRDLDDPAAALSWCEQTLAMQRRLHDDRDHPLVAASCNNVASCLAALGRHEEALALHRESLAMQRRLWGDRPHPDMATALRNIGTCLAALGRPDEALRDFERSLAVCREVFGDRDHPDVVATLGWTATMRSRLGDRAAAIVDCANACDMIERLRDDPLLAAELRQSLFDHLKKGDQFETLQLLEADTDPAAALAVAERSRGRALLDLLAQAGLDPLDEAIRRAGDRGDEATTRRLTQLRADLKDNSVAGDRLLRALSELDRSAPTAADRAATRTRLLASSDELAARQRRLLDDRARALGDLLPTGEVCSAAQIRAVLRSDEALLEYTLTRGVALLYVLDGDGRLQTVPLDGAAAAVARLLPPQVGRVATSATPVRGRDADAAADGGGDLVARSRALFSALVPPAVWERVRGKRRVFVAAHRALHRLPFEMLVTDVRDDLPVYWLDAGPPIAYVPSGSALRWLRTRAAARAPAKLDVLAVGDPQLGGAADDGPGTNLARTVHRDDLERIDALPQLQGARAEAEAIVAAFRGHDRRAELLLGAAAREPAVFERAVGARFLHFACHGVAEEYAGQSLSMLVLAQPPEVRPDDDGLLKLGDLLHGWRGQLAASRLVVLSACRTNVGPTLRDEAPQALPIGFLFAGAPAVVSSLWAVNDASTRELMTDFYGRLLDDGDDQLAALTAAKKALRAKYQDPFHWAPFVYLGRPEGDGD